MASLLPRSTTLHPPLSSTSRSRFPFMAVATAATSSTTSTESEQGIGGRGLPIEASVPSLEVIGSNRLLLSRFGSLKLSYRPFPVIGWNRHVETIFAALFRSLPRVQLRRECLRTKDDGAVALDWVSGDERRLPPDSPVLVLLPGLTGGSQDTYVRHMLVRARRKGWRVVVFNSRGCADSPVTTPQHHSRGIFVKWLNMYQHVIPIVRYMLLAGLLEQIFLCGIWVRNHMVVLFLELFPCVILSICQLQMRTSARASTRHELLFVGLHDEYNIPMAANARTVREFDEGLTRVSFGFKSVDDYYFNSSSSNSIVHVRTPLLCIQAANDPIAPSRGIPREEIKENPNCLLIVTPKGGHLGWVAGEGAPFGAPWTDSVVMEFLEHLHSEKSATSTTSFKIDEVQQSLSSISLQK